MALDAPPVLHQQQQQSLVPWIEITEQPMCKNLRFRYISEGRTAGSIHGERSTPERPTYPSIKIHNYSGPATVIASCMTSDEPHRPHPHHLVGNNCSNGICVVQIACCRDTIPFSRIGIQCCTRKDVARNLDERKTMHVDPFQNANLPLNVDAVDLTTVSLGFQAFIGKTPNLIQLKTVVSQPIVDKKVSPELSVCRLSRISGSVRGGDEVFLFSSKIKKENIKVIFNCVLTNGETWEKEGIFSATDVHKQYAIVFKTPPFHTSEINRPTDVSLYLMRPSDNVIGETKTFTYYPENPDPHGIRAKRQRIKADSSSFAFLAPPFRAVGGNESLASVVSVHPTSSQNFGRGASNNAAPSFFLPPTSGISAFGVSFAQMQQQRTGMLTVEDDAEGGSRRRHDAATSSSFPTIDVTGLNQTSLENLVVGHMSRTNVAQQQQQQQKQQQQQQRQQQQRQQQQQLRRRPQSIADSFATSSNSIVMTHPRFSDVFDDMPTTLEDFASSTTIDDIEAGDLGFGMLLPDDETFRLFLDGTPTDDFDVSDEFLKNFFETNERFF